MNKKIIVKKIAATNRKARFDYHIEDSFEAGIVLAGTEVKSIRNNKANIADSYAGEMMGEIYLFNAYIPEYIQANNFNHSPTRPRKLLLKKKQVNKLLGKVKLKSMTLIPLSLYFNEKNIVKIDLALARGKAEHDKRSAEKDRDWQRDKGQIIRDKIL